MSSLNTYLFERGVELAFLANEAHSRLQELPDENSDNVAAHLATLTVTGDIPSKLKRHGLTPQHFTQTVDTYVGSANREAYQARFDRLCRAASILLGGS